MKVKCVSQDQDIDSSSTISISMKIEDEESNVCISNEFHINFPFVIRSRPDYPLIRKHPPQFHRLNAMRSTLVGLCNSVRLIMDVNDFAD